jgi:hypothetical protein
MLSGEAKSIVENHQGIIDERLSERLDKINNQKKIDAQFDGFGPVKGLAKGVGSQLGRSATEFFANILKLPSFIDADNKYGAVDKWVDTVDEVTNFVDDTLFPIPSKYNSPLVYIDKNGNEVWQSDLIIPKAAKLGGDMAALFYGASKLSAATKFIGVGSEASSAIGLFGSSYLQTFDKYKKTAISEGLSPDEAHWFAHTSAAGQSLLELISPQKYLWADTNNAAKGFLKNIRAGMSRKEALKEAGVFTTKQIAGENLQEFSQNLSDLAVRSYTNHITGRDDLSNESFFEQSLETFVLTSIVSGLPAAGASVRKAVNLDSNYNEAIRLVAEDKAKYMPMLEAAFKEQGIQSERVAKVLDDISGVKVPEAAEPVYLIDDKESTKEEVSKRIEEGNLTGVTIYNDKELGDKIIDLVRERKGVQKTETFTEREQEQKVDIDESGVQIISDDTQLKQFQESQTTPRGKRLAGVIGASRKALGVIVPDVKFALYEGDEAGAKILEGLGQDTDGKNGFYDPKSKTIYINHPDYTSDTPFHEAIHPIINALAAENPERFRALAEEAGKVLFVTGEGAMESYAKRNEGEPIDEQLVDFLGDFADGHFDQPDFTTRVKKVVVQFLEAIGLSAETLGLDLNDAATLKDVARTISQAFNEGRAIKVGKSATAKESVQAAKKAPRRPDSDQAAVIDSEDVSTSKKGKTQKLKYTKDENDRLINRTAWRVGNDVSTVWSDLRKNVLENPDDYKHKVINIAEATGDISRMTRAERQRIMDDYTDMLGKIDLNNNIGVLTFINAMNLARAMGQDTKPLFDQIKKLGTFAGQVLRQIAEFSTETPEGIIDYVKEYLGNSNQFLTDEQETELTKLSDEFLKAKGEHQKAIDDFIKNPSKQGEDKIEEIEKKKSEAFDKIHNFVGLLLPQSDLLGTILKGNLMAPVSIVTNVVGNIVFVPARQAELAAKDVVSFASTKEAKKIPVSVSLQAAAGAIVEAIVHTPTILKNTWAGETSMVESEKVERAGTLRPLVAWWQLLTKKGRSTLPVNARGNVKLLTYLSKLAEGTIGVPATFWFRALYATDAPFRIAARRAQAFRIYAQKGGRGNVFSLDFHKFLANMTGEMLDQLEVAEREATWTDKRTLSEGTKKFIKAAKGIGDETIQKLPVVGTVGKLAFSAMAPFVQVPANLIQMTIEMTMPAIPFSASLYHSGRAIKTKGEERAKHIQEATKYMTRAAVAFGVAKIADIMISSGAVVATLGDDDDKERGIKYQLFGGGNKVNVTLAMLAFYDVLNGTNLAKERGQQKGDTIWGMEKLGPIGVAILARANAAERMKKKEGIEFESLSDFSFDRQLSLLSAVFRTSLEIPFMQGTANMIKAAEADGFQHLVTSIMDTMSSVAIPNVAAAVARGRREYILTGKDNDIIEAWLEKQSLKDPFFPSLEDSRTGVYPILSMWGEKVKQNRSEGNPIMNQFFNVFRSEKLTDPLTIDLYNLVKKNDEGFPITHPDPNIEIPYIEDKDGRVLPIDGEYDEEDVRIKKVNVKLDEKDYVAAQQIAGQTKRAFIATFVEGDEWTEYSDEEKILVLSSINQVYNRAAREYVKARVLKSISENEASLNPFNKTYKYFEKEAYSSTEAERIVKEIKEE